MSGREDDEDGEASGGSAAAEPAAAAEPEAAAQAAAGQKRCRLDFCAMHCNKNTAMQKSSPKASAKCSNTDSDPRSENNVNIVCDVAYDVMDSPYDIAYDEYRTTL